MAIIIFSFLNLNSIFLLFYSKCIRRQQIKGEQAKSFKKNFSIKLLNHCDIYIYFRTRISMFGRMDGGWCTVHLHTKVNK